MLLIMIVLMIFPGMQQPKRIMIRIKSMSMKWGEAASVDHPDIRAIIRPPFLGCRA